MQTEKYLKSIRTAGHCCEDVVGVHGAEDEVGAVPRFEAVATKNAAAGPTLKTRHAHGRQVARFTLVLHLKIITNGSKKKKKMCNRQFKLVQEMADQVRNVTL